MIDPAVIAAAQAAQRKWGIPASVTLAQYGIESAWGTRTPPGSLNFFGIKALAGQPAVTVATHEFVGGRYIVVNAAFRKFDSMAQAFDAHAELLATGRPYVAARSLLAGGITEASVNAFANALTGVYATAPTYGAALITLMTDDNLYQYDQVPTVALAPTVISVSTSTAPVVTLPASSTGPTGVAPTAPVGPILGAPVTSAPDFTPDAPIQLPSQVNAFLTGTFTHVLTGLAITLAGTGAIQSNQEAQFVSIGASILLWGTSLLITYVAQALRHKQAVAAVATAKAA